ncbi:MAG: choice-of-anchor tandem repeat GloVer-containing protein [Limisphaerales bacterium]
MIYSPPQITMQPVSQTSLVGGTAVFSVAAVGDLPLSYQWQDNGVDLTDGGQISGSATCTLTITNLVETNAGSYSVIVNNAIAIAPVVSSEAVLTVFAISATGTTMADVYSFTGGNDGGVPNGLMLGSNGLLYGTTQNGGLYGDGTIFSLTTNGVFTTLVTFDGMNGAMPLDNLTQGTNGSIYGTTQLGGSNSAGTVFAMTPEGALTTIYSFTNNLNGINPSNALALGSDGNFYGSAQNSSGSGDGIIFKMTPAGLASNIYTFAGSTNGTTPAGELTQGTDGNFYGMTGRGGADLIGNVFKMTPVGALTNLYSFTNGTDGFVPSGQLVQGTDGDFYGVTRRYSINYNPLFYGSIFKITPGGARTILYALNPFVVNTDGAYPFGGLIQGSDGNFYGTTSEGYDITNNGVTFNNSNGTVFQITPGGTLTTLTSLNGFDDGAYPEAALVEGPDGALYGTTTSGGPYGQGTIFRLTFTSAPQITTQPASQTNFAGGSASFDVTVFGAPQLSYQWRANGANLIDAGNISGSAARVLTLNNITAANAATYSVIVSNALGSVTSAGASLTVEQPPAFLTAAQVGGAIAFTWSAAPGLAYQLQSTTNLTSAAWTNLNSAVTATNSVMGASNAIGTNGQRFYRVLVSQ